MDLDDLLNGIVTAVEQTRHRVIIFQNGDIPTIEYLIKQLKERLKDHPIMVVDFSCKGIVDVNTNGILYIIQDSIISIKPRDLKKENIPAYFVDVDECRRYGLKLPIDSPQK